MRVVPRLGLGCVLALLAGSVLAGPVLAGPDLAQAPAKPPETAPQAGQARVDPERLAAAREVVAAAQGDRNAVLEAMKTPMTGMMQQMGLKDLDKAKVVVDEVVMPLLAEHYDELLSIQALSFAAVLSVDDLKAIAAFYASPAGRNLVKAQPQLTQAMLTGMQQWIGALAPEMQRKVMEAAEAHGWNGAGSAKPKPN